MSSFEIVCMTNAPQGHVSRFVEHYKGLNAHRIRIFYDGADTISCPDCEIIVCNDDFWGCLGEARSPIVEHRQRQIYNYSYKTAAAEWVIVIDIDEYLFTKLSIVDYLSSHGRGYELMRFLPAEAIFLPQDDIYLDFSATGFRLPYPSCFSIPMSHLIYPKLGQLFIRGLLGHSRGKYAIRSGYSNVNMNIHEAKCAGTDMTEIHVAPSAIFLAHFDAISVHHWNEKWRRRIVENDTREMGKKRDRQLDLFRQYDERGKSEVLFKKLYSVGSWKMKLLKQLGIGFDTW